MIAQASAGVLLTELAKKSPVQSSSGGMLLVSRDGATSQGRGVGGGERS